MYIKELLETIKAKFKKATPSAGSYISIDGVVIPNAVERFGVSSEIPRNRKDASKVLQKVKEQLIREHA